MKHAYADSFFTGIHSGATRSAEHIVPLAIDLVQPRSVVDVGCGTGAFLACFKANGVTDIAGLDGPWARPASISPAEFTGVDLSEPFSVDRRFDLAVSLEVAEHLPEASASGFVQSLTRLSPVVMFSAAVPHQGGTEHVNEQWPDYWERLFRERGYLPVDCIRSRVWNNAGVEWWYAQNTIVYAEAGYLHAHPGLREAAAQSAFPQLSVVHPRSYLNQVRAADQVYLDPDASRFDLSTIARVGPRVVAHRVLRRWRRAAS